MGTIITIDSLMDGAVSERIIREINKALGNVFDPNTDPKAVREVTLKIKMKPTANRDGAEWTYDVRSKLAPSAPLAQTVFMRKRDDGSVMVYDQNGQLPGQLDIEGNENTTNIMEFNASRKAGF